MGLTQKLGTIPLAILTDASNNVGIGAAPSGSYKLEVTGTAKVSSTLLVGSTLTANDGTFSGSGVDGSLGSVVRISTTNTNGNARNWALVNTFDSYGDLNFRISTAQGGNALTAGSTILTLSRTGAATFSSSVTTTQLITKSASGAAALFLKDASANDKWEIGHLSNALYFYNYTSGSESMRINSNGNTSIGYAGDAGNKLYVGGTFTASVSLASGYAHTLQNASLAAGANGVFIDAYSGSSSSWALAIRTNDGNSYPLRVRCDGNILANASVYNNTSGGSPRNIFMGTDYYFAGLSSIRASKKNIENVSNVDWLYQLNPVTFNYRKKDEDGNYSEEAYEDLSYGLIAEDTQPIADFLINYDDREEGGKKMIGIEYSRLITPLLKAIQELNERLNKAGL